MRNIIRKREVRKRTGGLSDTTLWRYERDGKFPKRVVLSEPGLVGWYEDEIDEWIHDRIRSGGKRPSGVPPAARGRAA
jgi:predicted DNA-binding transcriptional regulator AlpA